jgi:CubicO group peptidase (beta-lactamase class C family)
MLELSKILACVLLVGLMGCMVANKAHAFRDASVVAKNPPLPPTAKDAVAPSDYAKPANWIATGGALDKPVDVFYLYPTAWHRHGDEGYLAAIDNASMRKHAPKVFQEQAAAFAKTGNLFAPFYRQIDAVWGLGLKTDAAREAYFLGAPYTDAVAAFDYYIKHYNQGRPFILAGHSQGSTMLRLMLIHYFAKHPEVYERMIAAYVIGYSMTKGDFADNPHLRFAQGPDDTGVVISYNTEAPGLSFKNPTTLEGSIAINPITWTRSDEPAPASANLPSRLFAEDGSYRDVPHYADAAVDLKRGTVICSTVKPEDYKLNFGGATDIFPLGIYHAQDYPFYWHSLEANALMRAQAYVRKHPQPAAPLDAAALAGRLDAALDRAIAEKRLVGAVLMVSQNGKLLYSRAAGLADREKGLPMREDAIFRLASVSKPYTAMAAAALIDKGALRLDDPVTKWLPEFAPRLRNGETPTILVRHLLSHMAGLNYSFAEQDDGPYHKAGVSDGLDESGLSLEENLRRIASAPLLFRPGSAWHYSLATDVLGAVVAKAHGASLQEAMRDLVTGPLGLKDTGFLAADASRLAQPYHATPQGEPALIRDNEYVDINGAKIRFAPDRILDPKAYPSGGGGMAGTAQDLLRLLETMQAGGAPLVSAKLMSEMRQRRTAENVVEPGWGFALGWATLDDPAKGNTPQAAGTIAWSGVYGHSWFVDTTNGLCMALLTNTTPEGMSGRIVLDLRDAIYAGKR